MNITLEYLRNELIGNNFCFHTPYGLRHIFYADYTASGRGLHFIENKISAIMQSYANTHTEDDYSGKYMTTLLHDAEKRIKKLVNAGPQGKIVAVGSGATGALQRLQEMMGIYIPPVTKERIYTTIEKLNCDSCDIIERIEKNRPVIFVGPYEHHTNEIMWREAFADVTVIGLDSDGMIDLDLLEKELNNPEHNDRVKIASFSAGSNITGVRTKVYEIARICHKYNTKIFFDFAAVAPYVEIDMNRDKACYFDAVFFSPHKFLGGPATPGILVFNENIYRSDLPPTAAGGGTVDYVGFSEHDFSKDIETREKAGTPPIIQTIKTALIMQVKENIGVGAIEEIEHRNLDYFFKRAANIPEMKILGNLDPEKRISIVSFNITHKDRILHPKFVTKLLNDLFGIQSRAGCSCAGPYGHILLNIDEEVSQKYREKISQGVCGIKPGWARVNLHYTFTDEDMEFLMDALEFIAKNGRYFLDDYSFDIYSSEWSHREFIEHAPAADLFEDFSGNVIDKDVSQLRKQYFTEAEEQLKSLKNRKIVFNDDDPETEALKYFYYSSEHKV